jgi:hypothetical protein
MCVLISVNIVLALSVLNVLCFFLSFGVTVCAGKLC